MAPQKLCARLGCGWGERRHSGVNRAPSACHEFVPPRESIPDMRDVGYEEGYAAASWLEYHQEPVQLHSGGWSHWLVRGDLMFANAPLREAVLDCWVEAIRKHDQGADELRIWGVPDGGTPWAKALAKRFDGKPLLGGYVQADHPLDHTYVVDDVATTGSSLFQYNEPKLVIIRRGPTEVLVSWADMYWLPVFKEKPVS